MIYMTEDKKQDNSQPEKENKRIWSGLYEFLKEYSVIGLAIGVIVAQISKDLIDSIVAGLFTPLIDLLVPGQEFKNLIFSFHGVKFDIGSIVDAFLTFLIVMIVLYILVKKILKREDLIKKK